MNIARRNLEIAQQIQSLDYIIFSLPVQMYRKSYCTTPGVGVGSGGMDKMLKFYIKLFM